MTLRESNMEQIVIYQQNMCCNYSNKKTSTLKGLESIIKANQPDIVFLSEVSKDICVHLSEMDDYDIVQPIIDISEHDKAACVLLINNKTVENKNDDATRSKEREVIQLKKKRYIESTLSVCGINLECFFAYVQQAYPSIYPKYNDKKRKPYKYTEEEVKYIISDNQDNIEAKAEMLFGTYLFCDENKSKFAFVGGDLNTDLNDVDAKCSGIFKHLYDEMIDTVIDVDKGKPTWNKKCLDYALVSNTLDEKYVCVTEYIPDTGSDHKGLLTTIKTR